VNAIYDCSTDSVVKCTTPALAVKVAENRNAVTCGVVEIGGFVGIETGVETGEGGASVRIVGCSLSHPRIFSSLLPFSFIYSITFLLLLFPLTFFHTFISPFTPRDFLFYCNIPSIKIVIARQYYSFSRYKSSPYNRPRRPRGGV
jgi:hypothetical protein